MSGQAVSGMIVGEQTLRPVIGARVALVDEVASSVLAQTTADSLEGFFHLAAPRPGQYRLRITQGRGGIVYSPEFTLDSGQVLEQVFAVPPLPGAMLEAYPSDEVTRKAVLKRGQRAPRYPQAQRDARGEGIVRVLVVVQANGRPQMDTFRVLESSHPDFTRAVRNAVRHWRFVPAEREGVAVAQVKPLAFDFGIESRPTVLADDEEGGVVIRALCVPRTP
jgi:TonB family protein